MLTEKPDRPDASLPHPPTDCGDLRPGRENDRLRGVWLANVRQTFITPISGIVEISAMLLQDVRDVGRDDLRGDLERIEAAGRKLAELVDDMLDPQKPLADEQDLSARIRHELRTPLNHVIGYCDLWLEDAVELLLEGFVKDLEKLKTLAREILGRIDDLFSAARVASTADGDGLAAHVPQMIRDLVRTSPPEEAPVGPAERGTILVVDDNEINRDLLARRLTRDGHQVVTAADGRQALDLIRLQPFDLILLDIIMPELNGFEVLQRLKADRELRHIPVLMISAYQEIDSVARCVEIGADDYLPKPFNPTILQARVNACLEKKRWRDREVQYLKQIQKEQARSEELLHVILPAPIVQELKATNKVQPRRHENVAVLFCDIVGFTPYCDHNEPEHVVAGLQQLIEAWEAITLQHGVQKIKTIGDALMAAAGLLQPVENPVLSCVCCGLDLIAAAHHLPTNWNVRVGIHVGPVVAGVIGNRQFLFDLWGDTVNTAARMESHGVPGAVVLSGAAWEHVASLGRGQPLGTLQVKGKGNMEIVRFDGFLSGEKP
jgi:class 3 adenylate cyclase